MRISLPSVMFSDPGSAGLEDGLGVPKDEKEVVRHFQKIADRGYAGGYYKMAKCYENEVGVEKSMEMATYYYKLLDEVESTEAA